MKAAAVLDANVASILSANGASQISLGRSEASPRYHEKATERQRRVPPGVRQSLVFHSARALLSVLALLATVSFARADAQLSSWITGYSTKYARIYETDAGKLAGTTYTTWTNGQQTQSLPAYSGIQSITYSASWIYFNTTDLGPYTMGPWYNDSTRTTAFVNLPKNQAVNYRIPRTSTLSTPPATKTTTAGMEDAIGYFVDGVALFDPTDAFSYANGAEASPGTGQWHRDAYVNEGFTFDPGNSHQQNTGKYHNHADPIALRYLLGDHVDFNPSTKTYSESTSAPTKHSPILGWVRDGLPLYGPYGYSSPMDPTSGIRVMVGGFVKRDGKTAGVDNLNSTGAARTSLPAWATRNNGNISQSGPAVSSTYPFGRYIEDWAYLGDLIKSGSTTYQQGVDFDLNEYNVRYCVTPEFPNGTYAYFLNVSSSGTPQFPYNTNRYFFGTPTGGTATASETVTTYFTGVPNIQEVGDAAGVNASGDVTFTWSSVEGGTYKVEASSDLTGAWTTLSTTQAAASNAVTTNYVETGAANLHPNRFYRATRTALATYDTGSATSGGGGGGTTIITMSPATGKPGTVFTVSATISSSANPPVPPQTGAPVQSFTVGSTTVTGSTYVYNGSSGTVTGTLTLPANATLGAQTVAISFSPPPGQSSGPSYTQTNAFTISNTPSANLEVTGKAGKSPSRHPNRTR